MSEKNQINSSPTTRSSGVLKSAPAPVRKAIIAVCEKCGRKLSGQNDDDKNPSRQLQKTLKEEFKSRFGKGEVRPVVTSCMDICPKEEIAIGVFHVDEQGQTSRSEFFTVEEKNLPKVPGALLQLLSATTP